MKPDKYCCVTEAGKFYVDVYQGVLAKFKNLNHTITRQPRDPISMKSHIIEYFRQLGTGRWIQMYSVPCFPNPIPNVDLKRKLVEIQRDRKRREIWTRRRIGQYEVISFWLHEPTLTHVFLDILHGDVWYDGSQYDLNQIATNYDGIFSIRILQEEWRNPISVIGMTFNEKEIPCDLEIAEDFTSFQLSTKRRFKFFISDDYVRD